MSDRHDGHGGQYIINARGERVPADRVEPVAQVPEATPIPDDEADPDE